MAVTAAATPPAAAPAAASRSRTPTARSTPTGPDNIKVRGHAQHVFEKYQQLARDASSSGDRVLAENFLQHAEHYFRVLRTLQPNRPVSDFMARDTYNSNYDIDFEDESGAQADPEPTQAEAQSDGDAPAQGGQSNERQDYQSRDTRDQNGRDQNGYRDNRDQNQNRNDQNRGDQNRGDRQNRNRYEGDRNQNRDRDQNRDQNQNQSRDQNRDRGEYRRDDRPDRAARFEGEQPAAEVREERPREDRNSQQREPREYRGDRADRNEGRRERSYEPRGERADPMAVVEPRAVPLSPAPERTPEPDTGSVLRSQDGGVSHAPAFLQAAAPAATSDEAPVKRPRGRPKKVVAPAGEDA